MWKRLDINRRHWRDIKQSQDLLDDGDESAPLSPCSKKLKEQNCTQFSSLIWDDAGVVDRLVLVGYLGLTWKLPTFLPQLSYSKGEKWNIFLFEMEITLSVSQWSIQICLLHFRLDSESRYCRKKRHHVTVKRDGKDKLS